MADKNGTIEDVRNSLFENIPAVAISPCPFKGPEVAIIPVRYALDRSRYDVNPQALKPLPKTGQWADLPTLKTRDYTLRQLFDGYVYVFDETAGTLHEYAYCAAEGEYTRIVWRTADIGQDQRDNRGAVSTYLSYPRTHQLHIGYAPLQWTWRICEHLRSHRDSRALWMKPLNLASYCRTMAEPGTWELPDIAQVVADVDRYPVYHDQRFADSSIPTARPEQAEGEGEPVFASLAADVFWIGKVPDKYSALVLALDDPLAVLNDLGLQLSHDQLAYQDWQQNHEHKSQMAQTVTALCGAVVTPETLPASVRDDPALTRQYLRELDAYFAQRQEEARQDRSASFSGVIILVERESKQMIRDLIEKYGSAPTPDEYKAWQERAKWRREIDLDGAHAYLIEHQQAGEALLQQVRDSQHDLRAWAEYIGTEPMKLFVDTGNTKTLLYLQALMAELLVVLGQDLVASAWLAEEEVKAKSLFGLLRFGFSAALKEAFDQHANELLGGISDHANLASRIGELNGALNHEGFADKPWMLALKQIARDTFAALRQLARTEGKAVFESILLALTAADSRLASGAQQHLGALLRNLLIGQLLLNSPGRIAIDHAIGQKLAQWKRQWLLLNKQISNAHLHWQYPGTYGSRQGTAQRLHALKAQQHLHVLSMPDILDYQNNRYAQHLREEIRRFASSGADVAKDWAVKAKAWSRLWGGIGGAITWGVVMLNLLNTAMTYSDLTRDGEFSQADMIKVGYNLGWSANLIMAVFVQAPWQVVKAAVPVKIGPKSVGILKQTSAFWRGQGNIGWAEAVFKFRGAMVGMAGFAIIAGGLELWDLRNDFENAKSKYEQRLIIVKGAAVLTMMAGGIPQLMTLLHTTGIAQGAAFFAMGPWFAVAMLAAGLVYLFASLALNYFKQDNIGWWLRKSCWSVTDEYRHRDTPAELIEEKRSLLEIRLSPQIVVQCTTELLAYQGYQTLPGHTRFITGAWIQIHFPRELRGHTVQLNVGTSTRRGVLMTVELMDEPIQPYFRENGDFVSVERLGKLSDEPKRYDRNAPSCAPMPPGDEGVVWQTWVPIKPNARFLELQLWYPTQVVDPNKEDRGYLYQIELDFDATSTADGLSKKQLSVQQNSRGNFISLVVPE